MKHEDDEKRGTVSDTRWTRGANGKRRLVVDEVDRTVWLSRRREPTGWRNGAKVKP